MANERDAFLAEVEASLRTMLWTDRKAEFAGEDGEVGKIESGAQSADPSMNQSFIPTSASLQSRFDLLPPPSIRLLSPLPSPSPGGGDLKQQVQGDSSLRRAVEGPGSHQRSKLTMRR